MGDHDWLNDEDAKGAWEALIGGQKDVLKAYPDHRDSVTEAAMYIDAKVRGLERDICTRVRWERGMHLADDQCLAAFHELSENLRSMLDDEGILTEDSSNSCEHLAGDICIKEGSCECYPPQQEEDRSDG